MDKLPVVQTSKVIYDSLSSMQRDNLRGGEYTRPVFKDPEVERLRVIDVMGQTLYDNADEAKELLKNCGPQDLRGMLVLYGSELALRNSKFSGVRRMTRDVASLDRRLGTGFDDDEEIFGNEKPGFGNRVLPPNLDVIEGGTFEDYLQTNEFTDERSNL